MHSQGHLLIFSQAMHHQRAALHLTDMVLAAHILRKIICRSASKVFNLLKIWPASLQEAGFLCWLDICLSSPFQRLASLLMSR